MIALFRRTVNGLDPGAGREPGKRVLLIDLDGIRCDARNPMIWTARASHVSGIPLFGPADLLYSQSPDSPSVPLVERLSVPCMEQLPPLRVRVLNDIGKRRCFMATTTSSRTRKEPSVSDLTKQIETLQKDIGELTGLMAEMGKAQAARLSDEAEAKAQRLKDKGEATAHAAKEQMEDLQGQANEFIRTQPAAAVGIAAGLGFLFGLLMTRR